jgi:hypothetical protein
MNKEILLPFSESSKKLLLGGKYKHYQGNLYEVLAVARHSESLEEIVVYRALYGEKDVWARPLKMFLEEVSIEGKRQPRFSLISSEDIL